MEACSGATGVGSGVHQGRLVLVSRCVRGLCVEVFMAHHHRDGVVTRDGMGFGVFRNVNPRVKSFDSQAMRYNLDNQLCRMRGPNDLSAVDPGANEQRCLRNMQPAGRNSCNCVRRKDVLDGIRRGWMLSATGEPGDDWRVGLVVDADGGCPGAKGRHGIVHRASYAHVAGCADNLMRDRLVAVHCEWRSVVKVFIAQDHWDGVMIRNGSRIGILLKLDSAVERFDRKAMRDDLNEEPRRVRRPNDLGVIDAGANE
mmetsp:Transcript_81889/g.171306  ORF Transcript_81889/g.171306 Transcript_81889/m.171306 type:complete len:256 (+) Transcript_81889:917-1684(+)